MNISLWGKKKQGHKEDNCFTLGGKLSNIFFPVLAGWITDRRIIPKQRRRVAATKNKPCYVQRWEEKGEKMKTV